MRDLDDMKARAAERLDALTMPRKDITGYGPPPTIVSKEHAEAERDLGRAIGIAEKLAVDAEWATEGGTRVVEELRKARADMLKLRAEVSCEDAGRNRCADPLCSTCDALADTEHYERYR